MTTRSRMGQKDQIQPGDASTTTPLGDGRGTRRHSDRASLKVPTLTDDMSMGTPSIAECPQTKSNYTSGGLAAGVAAGSSTITATLGSVSGNTKLTVTAPTAEVSLKFTGSVTYVNSGSLTSGGFTTSPATGTITSVTGTGTIPGLKGGSATVKVSVQRDPVPFLGWFYSGYVSVTNPGAHLNAVALVLTPILTGVGSSGVSGVGYGLAPNGKTIIYQLSWTL
jgi:hypothetical protein